MSKKIRQRNELPNALKSIDVRAVLRKRGVYLKQRENHRLKAAALPLAEALVKKQRLKQANNSKRNQKVQTSQPQKYSSFSDETVQEYWQKQIHNIETLESHFDQAIKRFLTDKVMGAALSKLQDIVDSNKTKKAQTKALVDYSKKDIFDDQEQSDLSSDAQNTFEPLLQNMAVIAGQDANKLLGTNDPYVPSDALRAKVRINVERFAGSMLDTDQKHLTDLIVAGIEGGDSIQQIRASITDDFSGYSTMQADRITRTEVLRASTQSTLDAFVQSGVVEGQQWVTAGAEDECADYDGQVEALDGNFYESTSDFQDGEPPLHPNCRCILIPVLIDTGSSSGVSEE